MAAELAAAGLPPGPEGERAAAIRLALANWITTPGARPQVKQTATNFQVLAGATPVPITKNPFVADKVILGVAKSAANSVFVGFGAGVTVASGLELQAGIPVVLPPGENDRELWELQRPLEYMVAILAMQAGFPAPGIYRAPRVVLDLSQYFLVAAASTSVYVMPFFVPEMQ